jgi:hypothetical protein
MSPRSIDDPVFGRPSLKNSWWSGEVGWQHERDRVGVMIFRVPAVPNDADRRVFTTIRDSYSRLLPQISEALFSLWSWLHQVPMMQALHLRIQLRFWRCFAWSAFALNARR